jgi:hypothetical protein
MKEDNMVLKKAEKKGVFKIICPECRTLLWIDPDSQAIIKSEHTQKDKESLDELLLKEKKRLSEFESKFKATAELQREKYKDAQEKFKEALKKVDEED